MRILTIDGDCVPVIYSLNVLNVIEERFCRPKQRLLADYFTTVSSSGFGTLIALFIAIRRPLSELTGMLHLTAAQMFPTDDIISNITRLTGHFFGAGYSNKPYVSLCDYIFGDMKLSDISRTNIIIPTYCLSTASKKIFTNFTDEDKDIKLRDIALISSSIPTGTPGHVVGGKNYMDGFIYAKDPSFTVIKYIMETLTGPYHKFSLFSLGNIKRRPSTDSSFNLTNLDKLAETLMETLIGEIRENSKLFAELSGDSYVRMNCENFSNPNIVRYNNTDPTFINLLKKHGIEDGEKIFTNLNNPVMELLLNHEELINFTVYESPIDIVD